MSRRFGTVNLLQSDPFFFPHSYIHVHRPSQNQIDLFLFAPCIVVLHLGQDDDGQEGDNPDLGVTNTLDNMGKTRNLEMEVFKISSMNCSLVWRH